MKYCPVSHLSSNCNGIHELAELELQGHSKFCSEWCTSLESMVSVSPLLVLVILIVGIYMAVCPVCHARHVLVLEVLL